MKLILILFVASALIIGSAAILCSVYISPTAEVILHFDALRQPDFTGSQRDVLLILATGGVMLLINLFLAHVFDRREHFTAVVIANFSVALAVLLFIVTWFIIANNR